MGSNHLYRLGSTCRVARVEVNNPPITTAANGRCTSDPGPVANSIGNRLKTVMDAVIRIGRILRLHAVVTAS